MENYYDSVAMSALNQVPKTYLEGHVKEFLTTYMEATQLVNTYLNIEEIANNRRINDLPTKESTKPKRKVGDEPNTLRNKKPCRLVLKKH